jgi:hypothetical protein
MGVGTRYANIFVFYQNFGTPNDHEPISNFLQRYHLNSPDLSVSIFHKHPGRIRFIRADIS